VEDEEEERKGEDDTHIVEGVEGARSVSWW